MASLTHAMKWDIQFPRMQMHLTHIYVYFFKNVFMFVLLNPSLSLSKSSDVISLPCTILITSCSISCLIFLQHFFEHKTGCIFFKYVLLSLPELLRNRLLHIVQEFCIVKKCFCFRVQCFCGSL